MGNYKFRLSDMMPNVWFYKLRDMSKAKKSTHHHLVRKKLPYYTQRPSLSQPPPRPNYFYTDKFCTTNSSSSSKRKSIYQPSPKHVPAATLVTSSSSTTDIIIDLGMLDLPPILTKPVNPETDHVKTRDEHQQTKKRATRGIKLRTNNNSPRIARMNTNHHGRKSVSSSSPSSHKKKKKSLSESSFAIVKSSFDPQRDFKDSMVEMIIENNVRESKDLVELLALYLSLNADGYHQLIVKAFEQIWFDMANLRL
ncbi:transcription repressor OFP1-like [Impatiens glandulifera]|uniref:transcription repressor OFP1-like n=1 Tax=Impatiens glandulifera TaxID=253017 RepID=UPI001FB0C041|nr:transcription repressor OFP1-like [Impatiens glandulifera]